MRFLCIYFYICILCGVSFSIFQVTSLGISRPSRERSRDGLETIFQVMSLKQAYSICKGSSIMLTLSQESGKRTVTGTAELKASQFLSLSQRLSLKYLYDFRVSGPRASGLAVVEPPAGTQSKDTHQAVREGCHRCMDGRVQGRVQIHCWLFYGLVLVVSSLGPGSWGIRFGG